MPRLRDILAKEFAQYASEDMALKLANAIILQYHGWILREEEFVTEAIIPADGTSACYALTKKYDKADPTMHLDSQLSRVSPTYGRQPLNDLVSYEGRYYNVKKTFEGYLTLDLDSKGIKDISEIKGLKNQIKLKTLELNHNQISETQFLLYNSYHKYQS